MPRGAKRAFAATEEKNYLDPRSFVSLDGHEYLHGDDIGERRREVWERAKGYCEVRQAPNCSGLVSWTDGEMHHKQGGLVGRNDDMENLLWSCMACHRLEHAKKESSIYPKGVGRVWRGSIRSGGIPGDSQTNLTSLRR